MSHSRTATLLLALVTIGAVAPGAMAQDRPSDAGLSAADPGRAGWYLRGGPMAQKLGDTDLSIFEVEFDAGGGFSIAGGYDFGSLTGNPPEDFNLGARVDLELSGMAADVDSVAGVSADGDVAAGGLYVNGFLDFDFAGPVTLFTGLGVGHNRVELDIDGLVDDEDTAFGVQFMVGLEFSINEDWLLYAMSRGRWYDEMSFDGLDTDDFASSSFEFGVRYSF